MPGPEQPDKTSDKSSTQSGKLEKSAGEKLSQDAFPPPPKDGLSGDTNKGTAGIPGDKSPQGSDSKVSDPGKTVPDKQDQGVSDKKTIPPEKQPSKPPPSDFGSQPPPEKQPPGDFNTQSQSNKQSLDSGKKQPPTDSPVDKPLPPAPPGEFGMQQKEPTDAGKKPPVADSPAAPRPTQADTQPRSHSSDTFNAGSKPPVDQNMAARNTNQDLPEKLPQKQPSQDGPRVFDSRPNPPAQERSASAPAGPETPRSQDRVAPKSAPEADHQGGPRAGERPRVDAPAAREPERRLEAPQARSADAPGRPEAQHARSADTPQPAGTDRARSAPAAGESGHMDRGNLDPRDNPAASRTAQPDVATSRRGEAALAESLSRQQSQTAAGRGRDTAELGQERSRQAAGPGRAGADESRADNIGRSQPVRGSFERAASDRDVAGRAAAAAETGRSTARDAHPASRADGASRASSDNISRHVAAEHNRSAERAQPVRPEMKALAEMVGKSRADQQDPSSIRAARADLQAGRLPQSMDGQTVKAMIAGSEKGHGDTPRRLDDRGATAAGADRTGTAAPRPVDIAARTHDPAASTKADATAAATRQPDNTGSRQPARVPVEGTSPQAGARPPADAAGSRQPDRVATDGQGQVRQPVKGATDATPVRSPGTAPADGKAVLVPPQKAGSDAVSDGRTQVTADNTVRLASTRIDGSDRAPVKPGGSLEPLKAGEKRELTGAEIAIAAIVAAAGAARVRPEDVRIQRVPQLADKDPAAAAQDAATIRNPADIPIGFVPALHVEGDAIALRGPGSGDDVEKGTIVETELVQDQTAATAKPVLLRPTCLVSETDTLVTIAEELFHDANLGWLIADLNRDRTQERWEDNKRIVEVASRQELFVPVWQDIVEFYESRPQAAKPENLVTIVTQSQLDRELLNSALAKVVGSGAPAGPFPYPAAAGTTSPEPALAAPPKLAQDWTTRAAGISKATAAALLAFSNRWPKPPAAPASDDIL